MIKKLNHKKQVMAQMKPNYPFMTSLSNEFISNYLIKKYGYENVVWVIVWSHKNEIKIYLYERNELSKINDPNDNRPESKSSLKNVFIDFTGELPNDENIPKDSKILKEKYNCSYDYILTSKNNSTVDLDYVWFDGNKWKGIELTTWHVPFQNENIAKDLIKTINRRPSWKGNNKAHGTRKIVAAAKDLDIEFYMLCVNTKSGVSNDILTNGNAYLFPLDDENIDKLLNGETPLNAKFGELKKIIELI